MRKMAKQSLQEILASIKRQQAQFDAEEGRLTEQAQNTAQKIAELRKREDEFLGSEIRGYTMRDLLKYTSDLTANQQSTPQLLPKQFQIENGIIALPSSIRVREEISLCDLQWEQAMIASYSDGRKGAVKPEEELDLLFYCLQFPNDENAKKILDDALMNREPWRGIHLNARVIAMQEGFQGLGLENAIGVQDGKLLTEKKPLDPCLMEDTFVPLIPKSFNSQGLAKPDAKAEEQKYRFGKTIKYFFPRENYVAGRVADLGYACLCFGRDQQDSDPRLEVRLKESA